MGEKIYPVAGSIPAIIPLPKGAPDEVRIAIFVGISTP